jgi:O-antigen/teichoic acid export membrane protein
MKIMAKKPVVYNLIGSTFDKGLPMIVSALLTKFMSPADYGRWSLFFAFLLISFTITSSPLFTIFARKFYTYKESDQKMYIYFYRLLVVVQATSILIYYTFFSSISWISIFEILCIIFMNLYSYIALFFRYKKWDMFYMRHSFYRLIVFSAVLFISILLFKRITYSLLLIAFTVCHIPSFISSFKYLAFPTKNEVKDDLNEFAHLSIYGFSTSMVSGVDKLIIASLGFNLSFLGYYSFIYALTNIPTVIIEALKQTMTPTMFKEWTKFGKLSLRTKKNLYLICFLLFIIQFSLPQIVYQILVHLKMINAAFVQPESVYFIFLLSIGCYFFSLYHFINPIYFFNKKSLTLLLIQLSCLFAYFIVVRLFKSSLDYKMFLVLKTFLLSSITLFTFMFSRIFIKSTQIPNTGINVE